MTVHIARNLKLLKTSGGLLLLVALSGCVGALVPVQMAEQIGMKPFESISTIRTIDSESGKTLVPVGRVEGYSCKNKLWDPAATSDAALVQLKLLAAQRGAVAISNVACSEGGTSLLSNCWQSFKCVGEAYR